MGDRPASAATSDTDAMTMMTTYNITIRRGDDYVNPYLQKPMGPAYPGQVVTRNDGKHYTARVKRAKAKRKRKSK